MPLHGSLSAVRCFDEMCPFFEPYGFRALAIASQTAALDDPLREADLRSLPCPPICPNCRTLLVRPGITWYGELLPIGTLEPL
jgi:NAD+-dependent protein deacetylase sirtuin 5